MDRHWVTLEYPAILNRLATYTDFSGGRALALELEPRFDLREARELLALTREARALIRARPDFALGGIFDIRPLVEQARHGVTIQPSDFLQVRNTLLGAARVRRTLARLEEQFPALADIAWRIHPLPALTEAIARVLDERGEVRDNASPELARIRRELRITQSRLQDRMNRIISSSRVAPYLQEALITRREGRFVIPVQANFKNQVQGIVHARSSSGATLFIEPASVVEDNNALRELSLAEEQEIIRLLRELTAQVANYADEIAFSLDALAELDVTLAKARYGEELLATEPELLKIPDPPPAPEGDNRHPGTTLRLRSARHPLLDPETVVPVNIDLDEETHVLVITGPNTGGKTVTLKTAGLLTLMALAGMHIPADVGSQLSCFDRVVADIGDEQSIEQSLSTFSSHLNNILSFLPDVDHHALVLLDELGAGTDPAEGAALARSLLEAFRQHRSVTLVATHYPELKLYAHNTPGVRNASMHFDVETLAPTYRLSIGLPGRSNAFAIARRLGMPEEIVKRAQGMLTGEELRAEDMLADLHNLRLEAVDARDSARQMRQEVEELRTGLRTRLLHIEEERAQLLEAAEAQAQQEVVALREEIAGLRRKMLLLPMREAEEALDEVLEELEDVDTRVSRPEPLLEELAEEAEPEADLTIREGDTVRLLSLDVRGTVLELEGEEAVVQAGALRTRIPVAELELLHHKPVPRQESTSPQTSRRAPSPGIQVDLRGQTVVEALESLDRYLDQAAMAALPWVRIVHGKGTGTLRREVRRFIGDHPLVTSYETAAPNEGGEGATVARLVTSG